MASKRVAIIGCGVGGLTSIKSCLEAGLQPTCFEQQSKFGGIWNYTDGPRPNLGSVHANTMTNVSKATMCFSDYPMPKEWPNYIHHSMYMKYLEMYAKEFGLEKYVKLDTTVERLSKTTDHNETGRWLISYTRYRNILTVLKKSQTQDFSLEGKGFRFLDILSIFYNCIQGCNSCKSI